MSSNHSMRSIPNIFAGMDDPGRMNNCPDALSQAVYPPVCTWKEIVSQKAKIKDALTQVLEESDGKNADNMNEDIDTEEEKLELDCEKAKTTEDTTKDFSVLRGTSFERGWMKMWTTYCKAPVLARLLEEKLIDVLQVGYDAAKQQEKPPFNCDGRSQC